MDILTDCCLSKGRRETSRLDDEVHFTERERATGVVIVCGGTFAVTKRAAVAANLMHEWTYKEKKAADDRKLVIPPPVPP